MDYEFNDLFDGSSYDDFNDEEEFFNDDDISARSDLKKLSKDDYECANDYYDSIKNFPVLSKEEMQELAIKAKNGNKIARDNLIISNYRLCFFIARRYADLGVPFMDLVQEGSHGLMKAVENFDPNKGVKFSTYAAMWIRSYIYKAVNSQSRDIRIPENVYADYRLIEKVSNDLAHKMGKMPTIEEVSIESKLSIRRIEKVKSYFSASVSYDTTVKDTDNTHLIDILTDSEDEEISTTVENEWLVDDALKLLREQESFVLCCFCGFKGHERMTTSEIAKSMDISTSRVHQIKRRALNRLKLDNKKDFLNLFNKIQEG